MNTLRERVEKLLEDNHRVGVSNGTEYDYTCPSPENYPHQWLWDSSFHAIVLSNLDLERAKAEIRTLLLKQTEDGFVPCAGFWRGKSLAEKFFYLFFEKGGITIITQPPVPPISVEIIYQKSHDLIFLKEIYPKLKAFMDWFAENRDSNNNGLIEIIHPWETGIDSTPTFDGQLGIKNVNPSFVEVLARFFWIIFRCFLLGWNNKKILQKKVFLSENILMNSIYAKALRSMSSLAKVLNKDSDVEVFDDRYKKTGEALIKYCWSDKDEIFYDLDENGKQVKIKTISSLMPLILDDLPKKYVDSLIKHLTDKNEFWSEYPIPSISMDEKTFDPNRNLVLWRGPTWVNTNWFLSKALLYRRYEKEAKVIIEKTTEMIEKHGFWEFYNPLTGGGYGQPTFGWSTLVLDMLSLINES